MIRGLSSVGAARQRSRALVLRNFRRGLSTRAPRVQRGRRRERETRSLSRVVSCGSSTHPLSLLSTKRPKRRDGRSDFSKRLSLSLSLSLSLGKKKKKKKKKKQVGAFSLSSEIRARVRPRLCESRARACDFLYRILHSKDTDHAARGVGVVRGQSAALLRRHRALAHQTRPPRARPLVLAEPRRRALGGRLRGDRVLRRPSPPRSVRTAGGAQHDDSYRKFKF